MIDLKKIEVVLSKFTSALNLSSYVGDFKKLTSVLYSNFFTLLFSAIIINNLLCTYQKIFSFAFTPDEIDNTHNAWSVFSGLVAYKDFFDFKGPLYTFFNAFLISMSEVPASFNTLIFMRIIHFFLICFVGVLIYFVARQMKLSVNASVFAVAGFYMWDLLSTFGHEIRPDLLALIFMLAGLYLFIKNYSFSNNKVPFLCSGICFGLMFFIKFESIIFLAALLVFYLTEFFKTENRNELSKFLTVFSGFISVYASVFVYFLLNNGLSDFHSLYFAFNLDFSSIPEWTRKSNLKLMNKFFKEGDAFLGILTVLGLTRYDFSDYKGRLLLSILTITIGSYMTISFYPTFGLMFLPFCSILMASFVDSCLFEKFYQTNEFNLKKISIVFAIFFLFMAYSGNTLKYQDELYTIDIERQKVNLNWALKNIPRDEEVAISKLACPAYIFNKDIRYFKRPGFRESKYAEKNLTTDDLFEAINKKNARYFFLYEKELDWTDVKVKDFLKDNFGLLLINEYEPSNCIWVRKDAEKPIVIKATAK